MGVGEKEPRGARNKVEWRNTPKVMVSKKKSCGYPHKQPGGTNHQRKLIELRKGSFAELVCEELSQLIKASFYEEKKSEKHNKCE